MSLSNVLDTKEEGVEGGTPLPPGMDILEMLVRLETQDLCALIGLNSPHLAWKMNYMIIA